jgi:hypothetical protein
MAAWFLCCSDVFHLCVRASVAVIGNGGKTVDRFVGGTQCVVKDGRYIVLCWPEGICWYRINGASA